MPRANGFGTPSRKEQRHDPLHLEMGEDEHIAKYGKVVGKGRKKTRSSKGKRVSDEDTDSEAEGERFLDAKSSKRILDLAKLQQEEEAMLDRAESSEDGARPAGGPKPQASPLDYGAVAKAIEYRSKFGGDLEDDDHIDIQDGLLEEEYEGELQIDAQDLETLDALLPPSTGARKTLADMIFDKFESGDMEGGKTVRVVNDSDGPRDPTVGLDPKVVEVYKKVGQLMNRYRSGPLPKPFKILPALPSWSRLLAITEPAMWTPHAFNAATRILVSNLKPDQARTYLELVLLEAVRENLKANNGKLNVQLYEAIRRATYKPAAFFKGLLFPLVEGGCTLKEASVFASVIQKTSIPLLHSAAAILRLASMDYAGPISLFIRILLDKKYALPYKVVDGMVFHFIRIANTWKGSRDTGMSLPVLWHQSLLVFVQRYGSDLTPEQKDALLDVIKARPHALMGPEIRRQIVDSVVRGEPRAMEDVIMS